MDKTAFFRERFDLRERSLLAALASAASERSFGPKERIAEYGVCPDDVWFLVNGVVYFYYPDERGGEVVDMIVSEPGLVSDALLYDSGEAFGARTLTETTILSIPRETITKVLSAWPEMRSMWINQLRLYAVKYWKLRMVCANMSLAERMHWFRTADPKSFAVINNAQLASFLGSSRESISRVGPTEKGARGFRDIPGQFNSTEIFRNYYEEISNLNCLDRNGRFRWIVSPPDID